VRTVQKIVHLLDGGAIAEGNNCAVAAERAHKPICDDRAEVRLRTLRHPRLQLRGKQRLLFRQSANLSCRRWPLSDASQLHLYTRLAGTHTTLFATLPAPA